MKVLANFNLTNNDYLTNLVIYPHNIQPNKIYHVIALEYTFYRVVSDNLDNQLISPVFFDVIDYEFVSEWQATINSDTFNFTPKIFAQYPYFWQDLHDGDNENSVKYADIYMAYLTKLMGEKAVSETLYQHYKLAVSSRSHPFTYWQKQWFKRVFDVKTAIELRQFEPNFQNIINQYLENLQ